MELADAESSVMSLFQKAREWRLWLQSLYFMESSWCRVWGSQTRLLREISGLPSHHLFLFLLLVAAGFKEWRL